MKQNKLLNLLKSLNPKEFKQLEDYLNSPFFIKRRTDIPSFYRILKKIYPFEQMEGLTKELLFKKVYPDQDFKDRKFRSLLADFVKIVENYLLFLENEEDRFEKDKRLVAIYEKRGIDDEFQKTNAKLMKSLDDLPYRDANFFYDKYRLESRLYFHPKTKKDETSVLLLKNSLNNFEYYVVLERSKLGVDLKNREKIYPEKHKFSINDLRHVNLTGNYLYQLYQLILQLIEKPQKSTFQQLISLYTEKINFLRKDEQVLFFTLLQNFIVQQLRTKPIEYKQILFEFFKLGFNKKIFFRHGKIQDTFFLNIISIGLKSGEFKWVKSIIQNYGESISEEIQGFTVMLSKALLAFYEEDYLITIKITNSNPFPNSIHHFGLRALVIRATFKVFPLNSVFYEIFLNNCLAFEKYISRNYPKKTESAERNLNFIKIIKKIGQLIYENKWTSKKNQLILSELNSNKKIAYKEWLIESIDKI